MFSLKSSSKSSISKLPSEYQFGEHSLPLILSARRKSIAIKKLKGQLVLEVPKAIKPTQLGRLLKANHLWVVERIERLLALENGVFAGLHGESIHFLGQEYQCEWLHEWQLNSNSLLLQSGKKTLAQLELCHINNQVKIAFNPTISEDKKAGLACQIIQTFFTQQASQYLAPKLDEYAKKMGVRYQSLTVKGYKSRWGSCYSDGRIQFNWRLLQAPQWVVDYVVVHELAHLVHPNHSSVFWNLVKQHYPRTDEAKKILKIHGRQWIEFLQN